MERVHDYCKYMPKDNVLEDLYTNEEFSLVDLPLVVDERFGFTSAQGSTDRLFKIFMAMPRSCPST